MDDYKSICEEVVNWMSNNPRYILRCMGKDMWRVGDLEREKWPVIAVGKTLTEAVLRAKGNLKEIYD